MGRYMNELSVQEEGEFGAYVVDFPKTTGHGDFVTLNIGQGDSGVLFFLPRNQAALRDVQKALADAQLVLRDVTDTLSAEEREREAEQPDEPVYRIYVDGNPKDTWADDARQVAITTAARVHALDPEAFIEVVFEHGSLRSRVWAKSPYERT